jgi:Lon protease-like protein
MYEMPLFPLNTVLFPGMPINLHIFEPRYKLMIQECLQTGQPFGVVLIKQGVEASGPLAEPYDIGCSAQITQVDRLDDGRMNIVAIGVERFQIRTLEYDKPYLVGQVETLPLVRPEGQSVRFAGTQLRSWVERYLETLAEISNEVNFDLARLPDDPLALGYLAAALVQIPMEQKQTLLASDRALDLLSNVRGVYRREVALLRAMIEHDRLHQGEGEQGLFSLN